VAVTPPTPPLPRKSLPALLYALAVVGLIMGALGTAISVVTVGVLLRPAEELAQLKPTEPATTPTQQRALVQTEVLIGRRGAILPLATMNLILSVLLFAGCRRAMRGDPWGASAWSFAALASILYQVLATVLQLILLGEIQRASANLSPNLVDPHAVGPSSASATLVVAGVEILYYAVCVLYLRLHSVRRRFSDDAGTTSSA
jgi:hypothetical protein